MMGDGSVDLNSVMNDINSAAQRFFIPSDGELRSFPEDAFTNDGNLGETAAATSSDSSEGSPIHENEDIGIQDDREIMQRTRQDPATIAMFRTMRDEIMRLQRENRCLTRQLSIAQHELRSVSILCLARATIF